MNPMEAVPGGERAAGRSGERPVERTVADAMVTRPKTWPASTTTVRDAVEAFTDHVHLLLLVEGDQLVGTLARTDLAQAEAADAERPALELATLSGRTVAAHTPLDEAADRLGEQGVRRVAVIDEHQRLLGLLCLKRHRRGFCSDAGVAARAAEREATSVAPA